MSFWCKIGFHKRDRLTIESYFFGSFTRWTKCLRCGDWERQYVSGIGEHTKMVPASEVPEQVINTYHEEQANG